MDLICTLLEWAYNIFKYGIFVLLFIGICISRQCGDQTYEACNLITFGYCCKSQNVEQVDLPAPKKVKHGRHH